MDKLRKEKTEMEEKSKEDQMLNDQRIVTLMRCIYSLKDSFDRLDKSVGLIEQVTEKIMSKKLGKKFWKNSRNKCSSKKSNCNKCSCS